MCTNCGVAQDVQYNKTMKGSENKLDKTSAHKHVQLPDNRRQSHNT